MKTKSLATALVLCASLTSAPAGNTGQPASARQGSNDQTLTSAHIIEALKLPRMRSGGRSIPKGPPSCTRYRSGGRRPSALRELNLTIHFAFDSAQILPDVATELDEVGEALQSAELAPYCFEISGHTDNIGFETYNQALSELRAQSVVYYLVDNFGIAEERLISTGYGENHPIESNQREAGRSKNRRVVMANLGDGTLP